MFFVPSGYEIVSLPLPKHDLNSFDDNFIFMRPYGKIIQEGPFLSAILYNSNVSTGNQEILLVFRSPEARRRLPERINLDSRRLGVFPSIREVK